MLSAMPVGINLQHRDPMLDKAMMPSPQVSPTINYLAGCSAWDDDVWLVHIVSLVGSGDFFDPLSLDAMVLPSPEGCSSSFDMHFLARLIPSLEELLGFKVERMMGPSASLTLWLRRLSRGEKAGGRRSTRLEKKRKACNIPTPWLLAVVGGFL